MRNSLSNLREKPSGKDEKKHEKIEFSLYQNGKTMGFLQYFFCVLQIIKKMEKESALEIFVRLVW